MLALSLASGLFTKLRLTEKTIVAFYGIDRLRLTKPVFIGDTIKAIAEVVDKQDSDYGVLTYDIKVYNQRAKLSSSTLRRSQL